MSAPALACHATAVAIGDEALLIRGPSRAGKSRLAYALITRSTRRRPISLVGDDRVLLQRGGERVIVRPHPRIAGFLERRGLGIVALPWTPQAPVAGVVDLSDLPATVAWLDGLPRFTIDPPCNLDASVAAVLAWWTGEARLTHHSPFRKGNARSGRAQKIRIG